MIEPCRGVATRRIVEWCRRPRDEVIVPSDDPISQQELIRRVGSAEPVRCHCEIMSCRNDLSHHAWSEIELIQGLGSGNAYPGWFESSVRQANWSAWESLNWMKILLHKGAANMSYCPGRSKEWIEQIKSVLLDQCELELEYLNNHSSVLIPSAVGPVKKGIFGRFIETEVSP